MHKLFVLFVIILTLRQGYGLAEADDSKVINLTDNNWRELMNKEWLVQFHAPWCPACRSLTKQWSTLASLSKQMGVGVAKIDVTENPSLSGRFFVTALPTIFHVINGEFRQYRGPRDAQTLQEFITEKKWKNIEAVPWYFYPDSYFMGAASYFFKLSHALKDLNTFLLDQYNIPSWASYILFAIVTILLGALIGLLFVCIVDFIFPPKHSHRKSFAQSNEAMDKRDDIPDLDDLSSSEDEVVEEEGGNTPSGTPRNSPPSSPKRSKGSDKASEVESTINDINGDDDGVDLAKKELRKRRTRKAD